MNRSWSATRQPAGTLPTAPAPRIQARRRAEETVVLGRYRLKRRLGSGGFATVWLARDERLDRDVAVKVLPRERVSGGRFEREARAAARLSHPAIVTLYEAAVDDDGAYLVSELVRGQTLDESLDDGRLSDRDIAQIGVALCDALGHAHSQSVVHRDVKPSNVLVPDSPATPDQVAKLTDFGVARVVGGDTLTRTGDVLGTAAYMAPEQASGREAGTAADLYSLALVLYEALTGVNPVGELGHSQRVRRLAVHLPPLRRYRRDLPRDLARAIDQALRPRARERGSLEELRIALMRSLLAVPDRAGVVEAPWRPRWTSEPDHEFSGRDQEWSEPAPEPAGEPARARPGHLPQRLMSAVAAGALAAWLAGNLVTSGPFPPIGIGAIVGATVAALPRLGWIGSVIVGSTALLLGGDGGAAMVLAPAGLLPVALLPRRPRYWPLAAVAPALGLIGLAGAWPALAARAGSRWRRAVLGSLGWLWLLAGGALAGTGLYARNPHSVPPPSIWIPSAHEAARHVISPLLGSGMIGPALVWGIGALALPGFTATRSPRARLMLAGAWSVVVVLATVTILALGHAPSGVGFGQAALGALAAALLAALPYGLR